MDNDLISRQAAINALRKALYEYEDKTEKQFQESEDLDIYDWVVHRIFVQNMNDIDVQTILDLPSAERRGRWEMKEDPYGFFDTIPVCSECGCTTKYRVKSAYCPNCGARMEAE